MNMSRKISLLISSLLWIVPIITVEGIQSQSSQIGELKTQLTGILEELGELKKGFEEKKKNQTLVKDTKIIESSKIKEELEFVDTNKTSKRIRTSELRDLLEEMQKEIPDLKKQLSKARDLKSGNDDKISLNPETSTYEEVSRKENVEPIDNGNATETAASKEFGGIRNLLEDMQKEIPDLKRQLSKARDLKSSNDDNISLEPETSTDKEVSKKENVEPIDDGNATETAAPKEFGGIRNLLEDMQKQIPEIKTQITDFQQIEKNETLSKIDKILDRIKQAPAQKVFVPSNRKGFYILPGFASQYGNGMEWKSALGEDYRIDESLGFGMSGRFGHWWENFFTEFQVNFVKNDVQKIDFDSLPIRSNGEADQLSLSVNLGSKINLTENFFLGLGGGVGLTSQDIDIKVSDLKIDEHDTVFSPLLFVDFDYFPNDTFFLNWRYRYSYISEMKNFTSRNLHLLESSFGWIF